MHVSVYIKCARTANPTFFLLVLYCQQRFGLIKSKYAHCFHLPDNGGRVTYYERPGMSDFAEMRKAGISKAELLDHYVYCMEYLWQVRFISSALWMMLLVLPIFRFQVSARRCLSCEEDSERENL